MLVLDIRPQKKIPRASLLRASWLDAIADGSELGGESGGVETQCADGVAESGVTDQDVRRGERVIKEGVSVCKNCGVSRCSKR